MLYESHSAFANLDGTYARVKRDIEQLPEFRPWPTAPELTHLTGSYAGKTLTLTASTFVARAVRYGRLVQIVGPGTWILNAVVFSDDGYTLPLLGVELLAFRERMHLIVADLFPLHDEDASVMDDLAPPFDAVGETPAMPLWATKIFSKRPIFRKPGTPEALADGAQALQSVTERWLTAARQASPVSSTQIATEAVRRRDAYVDAHVKDEPANPFLAKTFGQEMGARLVSELLFPAQGGPPPRR